jgi:hypothetical protein
VKLVAERRRVENESYLFLCVSSERVAVASQAGQAEDILCFEDLRKGFQVGTKEVSLYCNKGPSVSSMPDRVGGFLGGISI